MSMVCGIRTFTSRCLCFGASRDEKMDTQSRALLIGKFDSPRGFRSGVCISSLDTPPCSVRSLGMVTAQTKDAAAVEAKLQSLCEEIRVTKSQLQPLRLGEGGLFFSKF